MFARMRSATRILGITCALVAVTFSIRSAGSQAPASPYKVIGYYPDWTANRYPLADIPAAKLTHVNYAFAKVSPDFKLEMINPRAAATLFPIIAELKQKHPHLKFIVSVGGWTDSGGFYEMAESGRQVFAQSCADFLKTNPQFDGVDMDWEHPVVGGQQRALGKPRDAANYVALLQDIRKAIGPDKLLTIAIGAGPNVIAALDWVAMSAPLDWTAVMTYDFHTGGPRTGYNAPLYNNNDPDNPKHNTHDAVQSLLEKGTPRNKLAVGIPFYSHGWRGVESPNVWSAAASTWNSGGWRQIKSTLLTNPAFVRTWDDVAKVPSLYNATTKEWTSYDDPQSVRLKGEYIVAQTLAGGMFWELSHDDGDLLDALRKGLGLQP
jgi:chitinase